MFNINKIQHKESNTNYIELENKQSKSYAKIILNSGGSLQDLTLDDKMIITDLSPLPYDSTFASAILFPFSNRIKNGKYTFNQKKYTLDVNLKEENNAIHGLVYNKNFSLIEEETTSDFAKITLSYIESQKANGFPYNYTILLSYTLSKDYLNLNISVKNNDLEAFPFNIGWHPYFYSSNLFDSILSLKSDKKLSFNKEMIPVKVEDIEPVASFQIKDKKFDDCFILKNETISFETPDYKIGITSSSNENYLQVFIPKKPNTIALEPITGPGNSFNNKLGLQILNPDETYSVSWKIKLITNE